MAVFWKYSFIQMSHIVYIIIEHYENFEFCLDGYVDD